MNTTHRPSRARRLTLLIGMLLHLVGAAAIPFHAWESVASSADVVSVAAPQDGTPTLPAHDELHCVLCYAAGQAALPLDGPALWLGQPAAAAETPAAPHTLPLRPASPAQARAPPHA